jgi:hypothetical protein
MTAFAIICAKAPAAGHPQRNVSAVFQMRTETPMGTVHVWRTGLALDVCSTMATAIAGVQPVPARATQTVLRVRACMMSLRGTSETVTALRIGMAHSANTIWGFAMPPVISVLGLMLATV